MKSLFLLLSLLGSSLYGLSLDEILARSLNENPSLESIRHRLAASRSNVDVSNQFSNPTVSYSQNTIDDNQAMSRKTLSIQQKLPYFGKRGSLKKLALAKEDILEQNLAQVKVNLVKEIKNQAYRVWELKRLYDIICDYEDLTQQNIELFESYITTSDNQHMGIMSAELTLSDLRIQKNALTAQIYSAYIKLSYLSSFEIKDLDINLSINDMPDKLSMKKALANNYDIAIRDKEIQKNRAMIEIAELNKYPDITLLSGYSFRKNFDNYWTFGIGTTLPIYGTEDYKEQEARKLALSAKSLKEDTKFWVDSNFQSAYLQMESAYEIYHIVNDEALPKVEHMFELTSSSISTGADLFKYIDILVQKLKLEKKSIKAVANYNRAQAKISALSGELK